MVFPIAVVSAFNKVIELLTEATSRTRQLERPQKVVCFLEVWAHSKNFMYQVFDTDDAMSTKRVLNDCITGESNSSMMNLSKATLVDEISYSLQTRVSEYNGNQQYKRNQ